MGKQEGVPGLPSIAAWLISDLGSCCTPSTPLNAELQPRKARDDLLAAIHRILQPATAPNSVQSSHVTTPRLPHNTQPEQIKKLLPSTQQQQDHKRAEQPQPAALSNEGPQKAVDITKTRPAPKVISAAHVQRVEPHATLQVTEQTRSGPEDATPSLQTPLQGAWAARNKVTFDATSTQKQQALSRRLQGTAPAVWGAKQTAAAQTTQQPGAGSVSSKATVWQSTPNRGSASNSHKHADGHSAGGTVARAAATEPVANGIRILRVQPTPVTQSKSPITGPNTSSTNSTIAGGLVPPPAKNISSFKDVTGKPLPSLPSATSASTEAPQHVPLSKRGIKRIIPAAVAGSPVWPAACTPAGGVACSTAAATASVQQQQQQQQQQNVGKPALHSLPQEDNNAVSKDTPTADSLPSIDNDTGPVQQVQQTAAVQQSIGVKQLAVPVLAPYTWTPQHATLAHIHASLLMHGAYHTSLAADVTHLITLAATSPFMPLPNSTSPPSLPHGGNTTILSSPGKVSKLEPAEIEQCRQELAGLQGSLLTAAWPAQLMQQYAAQVIEGCTQLVLGLGSRLHDLLLDSAIFRVACPGLTNSLKQHRGNAAQQKHDDISCHAGLFTSSSNSGGHPNSTSATNLGRGLGGQDVARKQANRERCRDAYHALAKDASLLAAALAQPGALDGVIQALQQRPTTQQAAQTLPSHLQAQALHMLRRRMMDLLAALHPDNLPFLAELFTTSIIQAANTGEAVMGEAVANLAQQDLSRFARLSARMQPDASTASRAPRQLTPSASQGGFNSYSQGSAGTQKSLPPLAKAPMGWQNEDTGGNNAASKDVLYAATDRLLSMLDVLEEFPLAQRGYHMLLDVCDSLSFVNAVGRHMSGRLSDHTTRLLCWQREPQGITARISGSDKTASEAAVRQARVRLDRQQQQQLREQLTTATTLAQWLSYLTHAHQPDMGPMQMATTSDTSYSANWVGHKSKTAVCITWPGPSFCAVSLLQAGVANCALPLVAPCAIGLLWHVCLDPAALQYSRSGIVSAVQLMMNLQCDSELQPSHSSFGAAAYSLRHQMNELLMRIACVWGCSVSQLSNVLCMQQTSNLTQHDVHTYDVSSPYTPGAASAISSPDTQLIPKAGLGLPVWDLVADTCLLELTCPALNSCCRRLQRAARNHATLYNRQTSTPSANAVVNGEQLSRSVGSSTPNMSGHALKQDDNQQEIQGQSLPGALTLSSAPSCSNSSQCSPAKQTDREGSMPRKVSAMRVHSRSLRHTFNSLPASALLSPGLAALLQPGSDPASASKAQLQNAMLQQYGGDDQPVKLRDICGIVAETVASSAVALALNTVVPTALSAGLASLSQAAAAAASSSNSVPRPIFGRNDMSAPPTGMTATAAGQLFTPQELDRCIAKLELALDTISHQVVKDVLSKSEPIIRSHTSRAAYGALSALLPPFWPAAVSSSAAAMTEEQVLISCAQRLLQQVPNVVLGQLQQQLEPLAKQALKQAKQSSSRQPVNCQVSADHHSVPVGVPAEPTTSLLQAAQGPLANITDVSETSTIPQTCCTGRPGEDPHIIADQLLQLVLAYDTQAAGTHLCYTPIDTKANDVGNSSPSGHAGHHLELDKSQREANCVGSLSGCADSKSPGQALALPVICSSAGTQSALKEAGRLLATKACALDHHSAVIQVARNLCQLLPELCGRARSSPALPNDEFSPTIAHTAGGPNSNAMAQALGFAAVHLFEHLANRCQAECCYWSDVPIDKGDSQVFKELDTQDESYLTVLRLPSIIMSTAAELGCTELMCCIRSALQRVTLPGSAV